MSKNASDHNGTAYFGDMPDSTERAGCVERYLSRLGPGAVVSLRAVHGPKQVYQRTGVVISVGVGVAIQLGADGQELQSDLHLVESARPVPPAEWLGTDPRHYLLICAFAQRLVRLKAKYEELKPSKRKADVNIKRRLREQIEQTREALGQAVRGEYRF